MDLIVCGIPNGCSQHEAAHRLLRWQLRQNGCTDFTVSYGKLGKPFLPSNPQLQFNLTHARGICACAVGAFPVGVDAEPIRAFRPRVARRAFSLAEQQALQESDRPDTLFFRLWTLKESYVKAIGIGISYPMQTVSFSLAGETIQSNRPEYRFVQYILENRYVLSLCTPAPPQEPIRLFAASLQRLPEDPEKASIGPKTDGHL